MGQRRRSKKSNRVIYFKIKRKKKKRMVKDIILQISLDINEYNHYSNLES